LGWGAVAHFGAAGELIYNQTQPSYSMRLRPDFTWRRAGKAEVVFDAKFRLERPPLEETTEDEGTPQATARQADLYKMHTYRDALGVRSAVVVYPGDAALFYDCQKHRLDAVTLREVVLGNLAGIGALPLQPDSYGDK